MIVPHFLKPALRRVRSAVLPRPRSFDVVVFSDAHPDWLPALAPEAPVWQSVEGVQSVTHLDDVWVPPVPGWAAARQRLVIPLLARNSPTRPSPCWTLTPTAEASETLGNKRNLAAYVSQQGLTELAPRSFDHSEPEFPCVLKRADLFGGMGVVVLHCADDLARCAAEPMWSGAVTTIQAYVPGEVEYSAHCIAVSGRIVWSTGYRYKVPPETKVTVPDPNVRVTPHRLSAQDQADMERFLVPLHYNGPATFDFKRLETGRMAVMEINPRFGGSLFRPEHRADLAGALAALVSHAKWRELPLAA